MKWSLYVYCTERFFFISICHWLSMYIIDVHTCRYLECGRISMQESFSRVGSSTENLDWPQTKQSTQFKHFQNVFFFANTVHFVTFEWSVNHCDPEWFYSPVHLWLLSFFFSCTDNWGHLFNFLHVLSGTRLCFTKKTFCYFICLICMAVSNLIKCFSRKCYKSILTPCTMMPVLPFFMSFTVIVTYPCACLHDFFYS